MKKKQGIAVLISGRGTNLQAILRSPVGRKVTLVISNNTEAEGITIAQKYNKRVILAPDDRNSPINQEERLIQILSEERPKLIALAGYMKVLSKSYVKKFSDNTYNIHPSLLPCFRGLQTHEKALRSRVKIHGCTVHRVSTGVDTGQIIEQKRVAVYPDDTEEKLAARVLVAEHQLYPKTLEKLYLSNEGFSHKYVGALPPI